MELKRYWQILSRYWWVVVILTAIGAWAAYDNYKSNPTNFQASMQINIQREPTKNPEFYPYDGYYANISSEYAADDFTMVVRGSRFLDDVSALLKGTPYPLSADELRGLYEIERKHREITFTFRTDSETKTLTLAKAFADNLEKNASKYLALPAPIYAKVLDMPNKAQFVSARNILLSSLRIVAGLIAGIVIAFLLAYLDDKLRSPREFEEALELPIIGMIPAKPFFGGRKSGGGMPSYPATPAPSGEQEREKVKL
jgi:capsular polysaccharide biosynthesis protein